MEGSELLWQVVPQIVFILSLRTCLVTPQISPPWLLPQPLVPVPALVLVLLHLQHPSLQPQVCYPQIRPYTKPSLTLGVAPGSRSLRSTLPTPYISGAKAILPSSDNKRWFRTRLASEYEPISVNELYKCPFTNCDYQPRQNLDSVCTHVHCHLNVAIQCHFCSKIYWSSEGWLKHTREVHKESKPVPADYGKERAAPRQDILKESMAAYGIALQEERAGLAAAPSLPATDYDLEPEHTMDYQTEETEEDPDIQVVRSE